MSARMDTYRKRKLAINAVSLAGQLALYRVSAQKLGWGGALRPQLPWNMPEWRLKVYYASLVIQALSRAAVLGLAEHELAHHERLDTLFPTRIEPTPK